MTETSDAIVKRLAKKLKTRLNYSPGISTSKRTRPNLSRLKKLSRSFRGDLTDYTSGC